MREAPSPDTDDWLDALAGRPRIGADPAVNAEAGLLRQAARRWPVAVPPLKADLAQAQLAALLAEAHRGDAGSPAPRGCTFCAALRRWLSGPRLAGAASLAFAGLLVVVIAPWQAPREPLSTAEPADTLRGAATEGVQRLRAADAQALRERIADDLLRAGVPVTRYERLGRFGLDADLPAAPSDGLLRLLGGYGLTAPPSGGLAVEVEAAP